MFYFLMVCSCCQLANSFVVLPFNRAQNPCQVHCSPRDERHEDCSAPESISLMLSTQQFSSYRFLWILFILTLFEVVRHVFNEDFYTSWNAKKKHEHVFQALCHLMCWRFYFRLVILMKQTNIFYKTQTPISLAKTWYYSCYVEAIWGFIASVTK